MEHCQCPTHASTEGAGREMPGPEAAHGRNRVRASLARDRAACPKHAARGRRQRRRQIAVQDRPPASALHDRVRNRHGRDQGAGVRMTRRAHEIARCGVLHDAAKIKHHEPPKAASLHRSASGHVVTSITRSDCYRAGATVAGRDSHPLGDGAFPRRTCRHQLYLDGTGLAVPGRHARPLLPARHRLGRGRSHDQRPAAQGA